MTPNTNITNNRARELVAIHMKARVVRTQPNFFNGLTLTITHSPRGIVFLALSNGPLNHAMDCLAFLLIGKLREFPAIATVAASWTTPDYRRRGLIRSLSTLLDECNVVRAATELSESGLKLREATGDPTTQKVYDLQTTQLIDLPVSDVLSYAGKCVIVRWPSAPETTPATLSDIASDITQLTQS